MKYTKLGNSDLNVSRICMGCMGFGDPGRGQHSWTIDEDHSREIIKRGLELGVNFYDTAIGYQSGTSEQYVGRALKDFAKREPIFITKNGYGDMVIMSMETYDELLETAATDAAIAEAETEFAQSKKLYDAREELHTLKRKHLG